MQIRNKAKFMRNTGYFFDLPSVFGISSFRRFILRHKVVGWMPNFAAVRLLFQLFSLRASKIKFLSMSWNENSCCGRALGGLILVLSDR